MCQSLLDQAKVSIWQLSQLLGRIAAVKSAPLWYNQLQHFKIRWFRRFNSFDALVILDQVVIQDLQWWKDHLATRNGRDITQLPLDLVMPHWPAEVWFARESGMAASRTMTTHQCAGTESKYVYCPSFHKKQAEYPCPSKNGQHIIPGVYQ